MLKARTRVPTAAVDRFVEIEVRQVVAVDLEDGQVKLRFGPEDLAFELAAVVQDDRHRLIVEDVAPDGDEMPLGRDQKPGAVGVQPADAAGPENLRHAPADMVDRLLGRLGRVPQARQDPSATISARSIERRFQFHGSTVQFNNHCTTVRNTRNEST